MGRLQNGISSFAHFCVVLRAYVLLDGVREERFLFQDCGMGELKISMIISLLKTLVNSSSPFMSALAESRLRFRATFSVEIPSPNRACLEDSHTNVR